MTPELAPPAEASPALAPSVMHEVGVVTPLVTVLITAHGRSAELGTTLRALRAQDYPALDVLVIDDASPEPLDAIVRATYPEARYLRNAQNIGYIASRSWGMRNASGEFILTLDDDSHPVAADAISRAVARFAREPALGVLAFHIHEGVESPVPVADEPVRTEYYTHQFIGCGQMMRTRVAREVGDYRDFFAYYKEEAEYALRVIDCGWRVLYFPEVVVHHRLSPIGRSNVRITAYGFRNALWTALLHVPARRALVEVAWKFVVGGTELLRRGNVRWLAWGLLSTVRGLPRVFRARRAVSNATMRRVDAVRFRRVTSAAEFDRPQPPTWTERRVWFRDVWLRRRRARPFWDRGAGVLGEGTWTTHASGQ